MSELSANYVVDTAETQDVVLESMRLRHQVFCRERGILPDRRSDSLESDEFDGESRHVLLRNRSSGAVVGTVRVVPARQDRETALPMLRYCDPLTVGHLPFHGLAEISRFALSLERRDRANASDSMLRLGLMQGILEVSAEMGLTHWAALMEPALIRLLHATGVRFEPLGPLVEAYGLRQPCVAQIGAVLSAGQHQRPEAYQFVTRGIGARTRAPERRLAA